MIGIPRARVATLLLGLLLATGTAAAQTPATLASDQRLPIDPQVRHGRLDNGVQYYVRANQRPEKRAELRLVVNAGSILEDQDQRGLAHFVEHMAFNGTRNFPKQELVNYLERIGMRFGPDLNAYTSFDETVFMLTVPTDEPQIMTTAFQILEDWASGVLFEPEEIERERGVVIEEWRARRGAQARLLDRQLPTLLHGSRYAERMPIGLVETLQSFPPEAITRFYRDWYRPDLIGVVAVGDFDVNQIEALIRNNFARIPAAAAPRERATFPLPRHAETLVDISTDPELTNTNIELYHKSSPLRVETVGDFRRMLVSRLFNRMLNARLTELTQKPDAPFLGASSGQGSFTRSADAYYLGATVRDGGVERGLEALTTEAERVARHGFTETELARHMTDLLRGYERAYAERERTESASHASEYVDHFLTGEAIPGIAYEFQLVQQLLPTITVADVNRLAREWITDDNRIVLVSAPETAAAGLPSETTLVQLLASVDRRDIEPYVDAVTDQPLLAQKPTPTPVVEETRHTSVDVTEWRLANGVRVLVKPTTFRDDEVILRAYSPGGVSLAPDELLTAARYAADIVIGGGLGEFSLVDMDRVLAGKAVGVSPFIVEREEGFAGGGSPQDLETLFELVYLYFNSPRRDPDAYAAMMERLQANLVNRNANPAAAFSDTIQVTMSQHHPRSRPPSLAMLNEMDLDRSLAFYRERFADASDFTFVLVGNLDLAVLKPLVETYLGGLPSIRRQENWRDHGIRPPTGVVEKVVRQGIEPRSQTQIAFTGPFTESTEDAYALRSLAEVLELRLTEVLREDLGGTYSVSVSGNATLQPEPRYTFGVAFSAAPERLDDLARVVFEQVERMKDSGPTEDEIAKVREQQRRTRETNLQQNGYWVSQILAYDREQRDLEGILTYDRHIEALNAETVRNAARRWLRPDNYVRVSLFPAGDR
jgi:zinc protease